MSAAAAAHLPALFARATAQFTDRVAGVGDRWSAPTPCSEWSVRDLVNHMTYEQLWAPHLVGGETVAEVGDRYEGDVLGADPVGAWGSAVGSSVPAFSAADLDAVVHLSYADVPCREYLTQMLTDAEVHGWDLARATGQDESLDPEAASLLWGVWSARTDEVRGVGSRTNADTRRKRELAAIVCGNPQTAAARTRGSRSRPCRRRACRPPHLPSRACRR